MQIKCKVKTIQNIIKKKKKLSKMKVLIYLILSKKLEEQINNKKMVMWLIM